MVIVRKSFSIGVLFALAVSLCVAQGAHATTVGFEDVAVTPQPYQHNTNNFFDGGLHFKDNEIDVIGAGGSQLPAGDLTQFIYAGAGVETPEPLSVFLDDGGKGGAFNLWSLQMGLGDWNDDASDSVTITGKKAADCTGDCGDVTMTFTVGDAFSPFSLRGFTDLSEVIIGPQMTLDANGKPIGVDEGWLGLDNMVYTTGSEGPPGVPEPAAWTLMIAGFGGIGASLRRHRRLALAAA
jgi:hypothetical protein